METIQQEEIAKESLSGSKPAENSAQTVNTKTLNGKKSKRGWWTSADAKRYVLLANAARTRNKLKRLAETEALRNAPVDRILQALQTEPIGIPEAAGDSYMVKRLATIRTQLNRLDAMLLVEEDPAKVDKLASATAKLAEQERIIAGRPLPGSRRPSKEPKIRTDSRPILPE